MFLFAVHLLSIFIHTNCLECSYSVSDWESNIFKYHVHNMVSKTAYDSQWIWVYTLNMSHEYIETK